MLNFDSLQPDNKPKSKESDEPQGEVEEIDDQIAQYTVEQFLDNNVGDETERQIRKDKHGSG